MSKESLNITMKANKEFNPSTSLQLGLLFPFLTLLMTVLKLNGYIDWSWWIVLSPMIFHALGIFLVLTAIGLLTLAAIMYYTSLFANKFGKTLTEKESKNV